MAGTFQIDTLGSDNDYRDISQWVGAMTALEVELWDTATPQAVTDVEEVFSDFGIEAKAKASRTHDDPGGGLPPWIVIIALPLRDLIAGFFAAAGEDGWEQLKALITRLHETRDQAHDEIYKQWGVHDESHPQAYVKFEERLDDWLEELDVTIWNGFPDESYRALCELDFEQLPNGCTLRWHEEKEAWYATVFLPLRAPDAPKDIWAPKKGESNNSDV
jgi:hypothetical protein